MSKNPKQLDPSLMEVAARSGCTVARLAKALCVDIESIRRFLNHPDSARLKLKFAKNELDACASARAKNGSAA